MAPGPRGELDARSGEVPHAPLAREDAAEGRLVDPDEYSELALVEPEIALPAAQPGDVRPPSAAPAAPDHDNVINVAGTTVKSVRATLGAVTAGTERANRRFLRLIAELGIEEGKPKHGWRSAVARRINVDPSYVSMLSRDVRASVGAESIDKACAALRLHRDYFYGSREPESYKDYVIAGRDPAFRGWREFRETPIGRAITEEERTALTSIALPAHKEPSASFYEGMLYMVQHRLTLAEAQAGIEAAEEIHKTLSKKRRPKE